MAKWVWVAVVGVVLALPQAQVAAAQVNDTAPGTTPRANPPARDGAGRAAGGRANGRAAMPPAGATVAQVEQAFDRYFLNQARMTLQLSPSQWAAFRPKLEQLRRVRRQTQRQRQGLLNELQALSRGGESVDVDALAAKVKALDDQKVEAEQRIRDAYEQLDATLSVPQRAQFRFFEQRMERQELDLIARARAQARRGGPPDGQ
jgi:hypothetical protein